MRQINELVSTESGFKFRLRRMVKAKLKYVYFCSQNKEKIWRRPSSGKRDRVAINKKFTCYGRLVLRLCLRSRTLNLTMYHEYHTPHVDISVSDDMNLFIAERMATSTPAEIFRDLKASSLHGANEISQKQVYYLWQKGNERLWKRDKDQITSASLLLRERGAQNVSLHTEHLNGIAVYCEETIGRLSSCTKELSMDATYGTNNCGMDLFAVLAEFEGTGVPLGYCFIRVKKPLDGMTTRTNPGEWSLLLCQFLRYFRDVGFQPSFFGTDKDKSEIDAVERTWPGVKVQLCLWHAKRAIRAKLKDSSKKQVNTSYSPEELSQLPGFEVCWAATPAKRPDGPHKVGNCGCPSSALNFTAAGRLEPSTEEERNVVLEMFSRHFNDHSLIPDRSGVFRPKESIYWQSVSEAYQWCRQRNYPNLWAYLYVNWYKPSSWKQWARAANASEIPTLKTTMIVESHWRKLKHDYLHRFNRHRIDLVFYILLTRVIPDAVIKLDNLLGAAVRSTPASWRKQFKSTWRKHEKQHVHESAMAQYHTDPIAGVCACPSFLQSRFLLCKHIVNCFLPPRVGEGSAIFFNGIKRQRSSPFWSQLNQLELNPSFLHLRAQTEANEESDSDEFESIQAEDDGGDNLCFEDETSEDDEGEQDEILDEGEQEEILEVSTNTEPNDVELQRARSFISNVAWLNTIVQHQDACSNLQFLSKVAEERGLNDIISALRSDVEGCSRTWGKRRHKASIYYK